MALGLLFTGAVSAASQNTGVVLDVNLEDETAKVYHSRSEPPDLSG